MQKKGGLSLDRCLPVELKDARISQQADIGLRQRLHLREGLSAAYVRRWLAQLGTMSLYDALAFARASDIWLVGADIEQSACLAVDISRDPRLDRILRAIV